MRGYRLPVGVLAALLICSVWNAHILAGHSRRLLAQLDRAEQCARAQAWTEAADIMEAGYRDWHARTLDEQGNVLCIPKEQEADA